MNPQRPERPVGIVLSAIALGLAALLLLLLSLGALVSAAAGAQLPTGASGAALPSAAVLTVMMLGMTLIYLALAAWAISTLVGLLRMRSWARISTMVMAGCLVGFGLLSALSMLAVRSAVASGGMPMPPTLNPAILHKAFLGMATASLLLAGFGAVWLIYLAGRRTREAFLAARAQQLATRPPSPPAMAYGAYPVPPPSRRSPQPPPPNPLTDFSFARPIETAALPLHPTPESVPSIAPLYGPPTQPMVQFPNQPPAAWPTTFPAVPIRSGRPTSITVLAVFALVGAFFSLFQVVSPLPLFFFGRVFSGWPVHLFGLVLASALAIAGLGMLRLQRPAWLLTFALLGVSMLNTLVLLLPSARAHYISYMETLQRQASFGLPQPAIPQSFLTLSIYLGLLFGLALTAFVAILLWRARWAFAPATPPLPPAPAEQQP